MLQRALTPARRRPVAIAVAVAAAALLASGCGKTVGYTAGTGDRTKGKELFVA